MTHSTFSNAAALILVAFLASACGGSNDSFIPPQAPAADITLEGSVYDGPVVGGNLYVFAAADVNQAMQSAGASGDRAAALAGASPLAVLSRDAASADAYTLPLSGDLAGEALFLVFDAAGAEDQEFGDEPFNMEAVAIAGAAGSTQRVNITPHTTMTAVQVRRQLDPDGDGTVIGAAAIRSAFDTALANAKSTFGESSLGDALFPGGEDPHTTADPDILANASSEVGLAVRAAAVMGDLAMDEVVYLFAADMADGSLDGGAPVSFGLSTDEEATLLSMAAAHALGARRPDDMVAVSCTASAKALRRACEFEVLDEFFLGAATCAHSESDDEATECLNEYRVERDSASEECGEVTDSRLDLCEATGDATHNPPFGPDFASNFVDPLTIGGSGAANPYFPMVQGTVWTYEATFEEDGEEITETITITVTDKIKLVDGIRCLVVRDVVEVDGELVEDTDDWFAQDVDGNIWYCGEEAKDYEWFDGDIPAVAELVAIDGSFKAGRDGDEAGILLPSAPVVGDVFRQEVSFANAEDAIRILATDGTETVPAATCTGDCLVTSDFSPLDPGVEEEKYYAPGIGKILEIDLETGTRVELTGVVLPP